MLLSQCSFAHHQIKFPNQTELSVVFPQAKVGRGLWPAHWLKQTSFVDAACRSMSATIRSEFPELKREKRMGLSRGGEHEVANRQTLNRAVWT
jgi:hypothetical protein